MKRKEICRSCVSSATWNGWNDLDEKAWNEGLHYCPGEERTARTREPIPEHCRYQVEYTVMGKGVGDAD